MEIVDQDGELDESIFFSNNRQFRMVTMCLFHQLSMYSASVRIMSRFRIYLPQRRVCNSLWWRGNESTSFWKGFHLC